MTNISDINNYDLKKPMLNGSTPVAEQKPNTVFEGQTDNNTNQELLTQLGITIEQYNQIIEIYPNFLWSSPDQQIRMVTEFKNQTEAPAAPANEAATETPEAAAEVATETPEAAATPTDEDVTTPTTPVAKAPAVTESEASSNRSEITSIDDIINYDSKAGFNDMEDPLVNYFYRSNLTNEEKKDIVILELVKAKFMAGKEPELIAELERLGISIDKLSDYRVRAFQDFVSNTEEFNKLKAEMEEFLNSYISSHDEMSESDALDEIFAKTISSRQDITIDSNGEEVAHFLSPEEYMEALTDKNNVFHKTALNNYQDFAEGYLAIGVEGAAAENRNMRILTAIQKYDLHRSAMGNWWNEIDEHPEIVERLKDYDIDGFEIQYISNIDDFSNSFARFLEENPDLVEKYEILQNYKTKEQIILKNLQWKIDNNITLTPEEQREYDIVSKRVEAQKRAGIEGPRQIDTTLTTMTDFDIGEYSTEFSKCKTDEERAQFMWNTVYKKYADADGNIPEEKRAAFIAEITNLIASAQNAGLYAFANDFLTPMLGNFTTATEKQEQLEDPWTEIDIEISIETESMGETQTGEYGQAAAETGKEDLIQIIFDAIGERSEGESILQKVQEWVQSNGNISAETKQICAEYSTGTSSAPVHSGGSQPTTTTAAAATATTSPSTTSTNTDYSTVNNVTYTYANETATNPINNNVTTNTTNSAVQSPEAAINELNLQQEEDQQKLVEIVSRDSSVLGKLDQQLKKSVLEVYCRRLDGAQIFQLFKKSPSLYSDLLKYAGEKLNLYKDDMFKILFSNNAGNMTKLAKELGINLKAFAVHNKEYATKVAIATKDTDFANDIMRNKAFYGLQMGSSEYFELQSLINQRNKDLVQNETPVYANNEIIYPPPKYLFKA